MKLKRAAALFAAGLFAATVVPADPPAARAAGPGEVRSDQGSIQSRIDQLAQPQPQGTPPQAGEQPGNPAATAPAPGSFPRSFLIPGTDTSIRIGGSVDGTASYYSR